MVDRNNFLEYGRMVIRFETPEERWKIIRILEEQLGFRIDGQVKALTGMDENDTGTFVVNLKKKTWEYSIRPFIGAAMMSSGVRAYSAQEFFRIAELGFRVVPRFPVFHIPHAGEIFPLDLLTSVCIPLQEFGYYHAAMSDREVWRFVPRAYYGGDMTECFRISRLLCDVERFIGPEEEMERYGMGFCYEKAWDGTAIKHVDEELRFRTWKYYEHHHNRMDSLCVRHPRILLFDMHSFAEETLPEHIRKRAGGIPDVCIGTDPKFTPPELVRRIEHRLDEMNLVHLINTPYSGTFVPDIVLEGNSSCDLVSVMLEFNKRIYCNENGEVDPAKAEWIRDLMTRIICDCVDL